MKKIKNWLGRPTIVALAIVLAGCTLYAQADKPKFQEQGEKISNQIAEAMTGAVPYPVADMKDSLERRQLRERLLRFNKSSKIGYVYLFNLGSDKPIGYYVIKGKISSVQSQMTNPQQSWRDDCGSGCGSVPIVDSIGDDGSYGDNEGGAQGVFFFTSSGVMIETTLAWQYSDAPSPLWKDVKEITTANEHPSSTSGKGGFGG